MANIADGSDPTKLLAIDPDLLAALVSDVINSSGGVRRKGWPDNLPTFSAVSPNFAPGATPEDVFEVIGATDVFMRVLRMGIATIQTTAGNNLWYIRKRSTLNSGGTPVVVPPIPHDSDDSAPNGTSNHYTLAPTADGTLVGDVWGGRVNSPAAATAGVGGLIGVEVDFIRMFGKPIVLRSASQSIAWSFNNVALPAGLTCIAYATWTEEPITP
jgi:hypothetical protein